MKNRKTLLPGVSSDERTPLSCVGKNAARIGFTLGAFTLTLSPCQAHVPFIPRDLAAEAAGDLSAAGGTIALICLILFIGFDKGLDILVRRWRVNVGYWSGKVYSGAATLGMSFVLWYVGVSIPFAARAATLSVAPHIDKPAHGGQVTAIGENHLEAVLHGDRSVTLYVQGITPAISFPVKAATVWAKAADSSASAAPPSPMSNMPDMPGMPPSASAEANDKASAVMLHAASAAGEKAGEASVFTGELPPNLAGKSVRLTATVPLGGRDREVIFRFAAPPAAGSAIAGPAAPHALDSQSPVHDTAATMIVAAPVTPEERTLFLSPGGAYTAADIAANGGQTPDQKWHGMMANHHTNPKKGAIICPVTMTQANPKFPWTIGGKKYLFCCPPCVAEFVKEAKVHPKSLKGPETYVQR